MENNKTPTGEGSPTPKIAKRHVDRRKERLWATTPKKEDILFDEETEVITSIKGVPFKKVKLEQLKAFLRNLKVTIPNKPSDKKLLPRRAF
jgi:endonuclease III